MHRGDRNDERPAETFWQWFGLIVLLACWVAEGATVPGEESGENGEKPVAFVAS